MYLPLPGAPLLPSPPFPSPPDGHPVAIRRSATPQPRSLATKGHAGVRTLASYTRKKPDIGGCGDWGGGTARLLGGGGDGGGGAARWRVRVAPQKNDVCRPPPRPSPRLPDCVWRFRVAYHLIFYILFMLEHREASPRTLRLRPYAFVRHHAACIHQL